MEIDGNPWNFHGIPWNPMDGVPWSIHGVPWNPMEYPWSSMEFHEVLMEVNGIPWSIVAFVHGMP